MARFHIFTMQVQPRSSQISADLGTLSAAPTLQKLHDFTYSPCRFSSDQARSSQTLEPYHLFPRCRNCTISYIHHASSAQIWPDQRRPWNPISCSHAAEIERFHIAGSAQISPHQLRSSQIILNQLRSCQISPDQPRSAQITPDHLRSA